jgi:hypothetical protein
MITIILDRMGVFVSHILLTKIRACGLFKSLVYIQMVRRLASNRRCLIGWVFALVSTTECHSYLQ